MVFTQRVSWRQASANCLSMGRMLLEPRTQEKFDIALNIMTDLGTHIWLGANDLEEEGKWVWESDGAPVRADAGWSPGEPNDYKGGEDCMAMDVIGGLNDLPCGGDRMHPYVCDAQ